MEKIIQSKRDISELLIAVKKDITQIRTNHFNNGTVTKESWQASPSSRVSFHKSKIPMLKAAGVMKDPKDFEYGWHFPNDYYAKVKGALTDADKQLAEILNFLKSCHIRQKNYSFSEELSLFTVIEGDGRDSWVISHLKGGVDNG
jgi:hypothetical protein